METITQDQAKQIEENHCVMVDRKTMTLNFNCMSSLRDTKKDSCYGWISIPDSWIDEAERGSNE